MTRMTPCSSATSGSPVPTPPWPLARRGAGAHRHLPRPPGRPRDRPRPPAPATLPSSATRGDASARPSSTTSPTSPSSPSSCSAGKSRPTSVRSRGRPPHAVRDRLSSPTQHPAPGRRGDRPAPRRRWKPPRSPTRIPPSRPTSSGCSPHRCLSPKVSVSGHVYDIATGRVTTALDARYREGLVLVHTAPATHPADHCCRTGPWAIRQRMRDVVVIASAHPLLEALNLSLPNEPRETSATDRQFQRRSAPS